MVLNGTKTSLRNETFLTRKSSRMSQTISRFSASSRQNLGNPSMCSRKRNSSVDIRKSQKLQLSLVRCLEITKRNSIIIDDESPPLIPVSSEKNKHTVLEDGLCMLIMSDLIYVLTNLRRHAKQTSNTKLLQQLAIPQHSFGLSFTIAENANLVLEDPEAAEFSMRVLMYVNEDELGTCDEEDGGTNNTAGVDNSDNMYSSVEYLANCPENYVRSCVYDISVDHSAKRIIITFRGTTNSHDWITNFDLLPRCKANPIHGIMLSTSMVWVHRGFSKAILRQRDQIVSWIGQYKKDHPKAKDYSTFTTGHSMGGDLATIFAYYTCLGTDITAHKSLVYYTFGAPPVGKKNFAKVFRRLEDDGKIRLARFCNANDPVPNCLKVHGYIQNGQGIEMRSGGNL